MNRFLADTLALLNGAIAIAFIFTGAYLGYKTQFGGLFTTLLGFALGMIAAALTCGVISYLALIESDLAYLAGHQKEVHGNISRREPTL